MSMNLKSIHINKTGLIKLAEGSTGMRRKLNQEKKM